MPQNEPSPSSAEAALAIVRGELSPLRLWSYRLTLTAASIVLAMVLSLWLTEPRPLPVRLHVAFAAMTLVAVGWIGVLIVVLTRKTCPTALDRLLTSWMATVACLAFLAVSVPTAIVRDNMQAALSLSATGVALLAVAVVLLRRAYVLRAELKSKIAELQHASGG
jgi:hypothetical protein